MESPLIFIVTFSGELPSRHWNSGLGSSEWGWDPLLFSGDLRSQDISPDAQLLHMGVEPACFAFLPLVPVLIHLLCILSYSSVQLAFSCFSRLIYNLVVILK